MADVEGGAGGRPAASPSPSSSPCRARAAVLPRGPQVRGAQRPPAVACPASRRRRPVALRATSPRLNDAPAPALPFLPCLSRPPPARPPPAPRQPSWRDPAAGDARPRGAASRRRRGAVRPSAATGPPVGARGRTRACDPDMMALAKPLAGGLPIGALPRDGRGVVGHRPGRPRHDVRRQTRSSPPPRRRRFARIADPAFLAANRRRGARRAGWRTARAQAPLAAAHPALIREVARPPRRRPLRGRRPRRAAQGARARGAGRGPPRHHRRRLHAAPVPAAHHLRGGGWEFGPSACCAACCPPCTPRRRRRRGGGTRG